MAYGLNDRPTVWVVDDDKSIRWVLDKALQKSRLPYRMFADGQEVLDALNHWTRTPENMRQAGDYPALLLSDIRMPGVSGISLLRDFKQFAPDVPVVMMTAHADLENAVSTFQEGAAEYIAKPFDTEELMALLKRFLQPVTQTTTESTSEQTQFGLLGQSPAILQILRTIGRLSATQVNVLLTGETGTGKELVARAIHATSRGHDAPFVAISTAAIPAHMLESELFGHEKGAFVGASQMRAGRFEEAAGGTLFLDEIGDMPLDLQARLLRVLSEGVYYRVGGNALIKTNVRIIAATHQNLAARVEQGLFRSDLYHRLNVIGIHLPPLRERAEDIPLLMQHFLQQAAHDLGLSAAKILSESAMNICQKATWLGNVRQLDNVCRWLTVMTPTQIINENDLPNELSALPALPQDSEAASQPSVYWQEALRLAVTQALTDKQPAVMLKMQEQFEQVVIGEALKFTHNHRQKAAELLGIGRNTITRKVRD
ncbi:nitrogen regulation protein NR(I) [Hydromonas duriensis]|uniref:DNA-binding transcriptional regulator NtrC n=1 Tax=Hydromonas duriensis TaxID=1527608 RepID=A0A4R6YBL2_9BURK|nr:nitrogen regulation protein NR(I) [Hydromonas duriensis]TDR33077.1 two-component system nitrogen regulation response regulator GlnG [Hydromonas duriensis]